MFRDELRTFMMATDNSRVAEYDSRMMVCMAYLSCAASLLLRVGFFSVANKPFNIFHSSYTHITHTQEIALRKIRA